MRRLIGWMVVLVVLLGMGAVMWTAGSLVVESVTATIDHYGYSSSAAAGS